MDKIQYFANTVEHKVIPVKEVTVSYNCGVAYTMAVRHYLDGSPYNNYPKGWLAQRVDTDKLFDTEDEAYECVENGIRYEHTNAVAEERRLREKLDSVLNHRKLLKDSATHEQS